VLSLLACCWVSTCLGEIRTFDGAHDLSKIELSVVYFVPNDRVPLKDWRDRVDYYVRRVIKFHERELDGQSQVVAKVHPEPLISPRKTAEFRTGDQDRTFFTTMDEVRARLPWKPEKAEGYPALLVLSDINWRELDDFRRVRVVDGKEVFEGSKGDGGRHFPGAESGGARATYDANKGFGMGLVSGDGWRVPYSGGSDCVVYHEGLGHSISLPHPEPIDDSVMGTGQYHFWINETVINRGQKLKLGWKPPEQPIDLSTELFTHFRALQQPISPAVDENVELKFKWPEKARVKSLRVRYQTELTGAWRDVPSEVHGAPPETLPLGKFSGAGPISYRVDVALDDGQTEEIWGYFQVIDKGSTSR
jgi:hypothetical protein